MPNPIEFTIEQLRGMTRAQIRQAIQGYFTPLSKRELIIWLLKTDIVQDDPLREFGTDGQITRQVDYSRDVETGAKLRSRVTTWSYYSTGEVNVITIKDLDASDLGTRVMKIKHYRDGREPEVLP